uniref:Uncharacterized protein n=1 Tax=Aquila chrysaetos chrysaetos TaxID=223781 RepID=A0A663EQL0_AQUCH
QTSQHLLLLSKRPEIRLSYSPAGNSFPNTLRNYFSLHRETAVISDSNCPRRIRSPRTCTGPKVGRRCCRGAC